MTETITSYCRMCPASCGVRVTVDNGAAVQLAGDRDHPVSRGYVCPKGRRMAKLARCLRLDILPGGLDPDACSDEDICAVLASGLPAPWEQVPTLVGMPVTLRVV